MNTDYDLNIWGPDENTLHLTAYEWEIAPDGDIQMNTRNFHHLEFKYPEDVKEIEFLLDDLWVNHYPLTDYDEWRDYGEVYNKDNTPERIKTFLELLPNYEMENNG